MDRISVDPLSKWHPLYMHVMYSWMLFVLTCVLACLLERACVCMYADRYSMCTCVCMCTYNPCVYANAHTIHACMLIHIDLQVQSLKQLDQAALSEGVGQTLSLEQLIDAERRRFKQTLAEERLRCLHCLRVCACVCVCAGLLVLRTSVCVCCVCVCVHVVRSC